MNNKQNNKWRKRLKEDNELIQFIAEILTQQHTKDIEKFREIIGEKENVTVVKKSPETEFLLNEIPASQGRNDFRHQLLSELNKL